MREHALGAARTCQKMAMRYNSTPGFPPSSQQYTGSHDSRRDRRGSIVVHSWAFVGAFALVTSLPSTADTPLQIWFIRHGESEINVPGNPRTVPDGGVSYPLTREGHGTGTRAG